MPALPPQAHLLATEVPQPAKHPVRRLRDRTRRSGLDLPTAIPRPLRPVGRRSDRHDHLTDTLGPGSRALVPVPSGLCCGLVQAVDGDESAVRSASRSWISDSRNLRWPPGVRMDPMRPADAHRVTVLGSTLNSRATSPGVSHRSGLCTITG